MVGGAALSAGWFTYIKVSATLGQGGSLKYRYTLRCGRVSMVYIPLGWLGQGETPT